MSDYERAYYGTPNPGTPSQAVAGEAGWTDHGEPTSAAGLALRDRIHGFINAAAPVASGALRTAAQAFLATTEHEWADNPDWQALRAAAHPDTAGEPGERTTMRPPWRDGPMKARYDALSDD